MTGKVTNTLYRITAQFRVSGVNDDWQNLGEALRDVLRAHDAKHVCNSMPSQGKCDVDGWFSNLKTAKKAYADVAPCLASSHRRGSVRLRKYEEAYPDPTDATKHVVYTELELIDECETV